MGAQSDWLVQIIYENNILFGTPPCGLGRTWHSNSKMNFTGTKCDEVNRIQLAPVESSFLFCEKRNWVGYYQ